MVNEYGQEIPQSQTAEKPVALHCEETPHYNQKTPGKLKRKATSSLFPIMMIANLEWTYGNS